MLGNQRYPLPCGHQTERCSAIQNYCQGPWEKEQDICKHKPESVSRRFSNRNRFLSDFRMFPWFWWCTCSKTSLDSAGGNRQLAEAIPDKNILTALKNRFLRSIHSSFFLAQSQNTWGEFTGRSRVSNRSSSQCDSNRGIVCIKETEQVYLPPQINLTSFILLPKVWLLLSNVTRIILC